MPLKYLFLIPARGGSKGVEGKNLRFVGGLPLVGRSARLACRALKALGESGRVVCSTDDRKIAEAAREWGAEVPFLRPAELATDSAPTIDVITHAFDALELEDSCVVVLLQPTSPLTEVNDVIGAIKLHHDSGAPVVSVCELEHPAAWQVDVAVDARLQWKDEGVRPTRRQDAQQVYRLNGAVYVAKVEQLRCSGGFFSNQTRAYLMPIERSVDIDSTLDLMVASTALEAEKVDTIEIAGRPLGPTHPCFVIAAVDCMFRREIDNAHLYVDAVASAGLDAVHFQSFAEEWPSNGDLSEDQQQRCAKDEILSQADSGRRLGPDADVYRVLNDHCNERGIMLIGSAFDAHEVDIFDDIGVAAFKIPASVLTNHRLLKHIARKGRPVFISTGSATLSELDAALNVLHGADASSIVIISSSHKSSSDPEGSELSTMVRLRATFNVLVGYSDQGETDLVTLAAVGLGASVVERNLSIEAVAHCQDVAGKRGSTPLASLIRQIRVVERARRSDFQELS